MDGGKLLPAGSLLPRPAALRKPRKHNMLHQVRPPMQPPRNVRVF